jgi:hypothetical protein
VAANYIARWNGISWSALGSGLGNHVYALTVLPNGDVVAGGYFGIARWNGASWSALGSGTNDYVLALAVLPNGDVAAGGPFTTAGGVAAGYWSIWNDGHPAVASQPVGATTCAGAAAVFSVIATGDAPLAYQWQVQAAPNDWVDLAGSAVPLPCGGSAYATLPNAAITSIGVTPCPGVNRYQVRCTVSNACGSVTSNEGTLLINSADFNGDGDVGTDADIDAFFACLGGNCCANCGSADFNGDGDVGTDADIDAFFRVLSGGGC